MITLFCIQFFIVFHLRSTLITQINIIFNLSDKETGHFYNIINLINTKIYRLYILKKLGNHGVCTERSVLMFNTGASYSIHPEFETQRKTIIYRYVVSLIAFLRIPQLPPNEFNL
jgi:hypothetical protein